MNFPPTRAPRMMIALLAEPTDKRTDVAILFVVLVVPHQITGDTNFVRLASSRGKTVVRQPQERCQFLDANTAAIKQRLRPRCNFANDRCRIAELGRMVGRL